MSDRDAGVIVCGSERWSPSLHVRQIIKAGGGPRDSASVASPIGFTTGTGSGAVAKIASHPH